MMEQWGYQFYNGVSKIRMMIDCCSRPIDFIPVRYERHWNPQPILSGWIVDNFIDDSRQIGAFDNDWVIGHICYPCESYA